MFYRRSRRHGDLDFPLLHWNPLDPWTVRHACGGLAIYGRTGSGKTTGSGNATLRALVRYRNTGGLILASKPEDKDYVMRLFREERTLEDLLIFEPGGEFRFNVLAYEQSRGATAQVLTQLLMILSETLDRLDGGGSQGGEPIWRQKTREGLNYANELLIRAGGTLDPWALQCFFSSAAMSLEQLADPEWKNSYHSKVLERASQNTHTDIQKHDHSAACQHFTSDWVRLNDRTRSSVESCIGAVLHVFNQGIVRDLLATSSNISPDVLEQRKWWLVNCPIVPGDIVSTFINSAVKLEVQRYILARRPDDDSPLLCIYCDEFPKICNSYDSYTLNEIRSHKGAFITLQQSVSGIYAAMGKSGEHLAESLLSQYGHSIYHTSDTKTARVGSESLGSRIEMMKGGSPRQPQDTYDSFMGRSHFMPNFNSAYEPILQPLASMSGLRNGGPDNDYMVDGYVIRPGMPFKSSGENYVLTSWQQS